MLKYVLLGLASAAAVVLSSCTCPACQGSGLQVRSKTGVMVAWTGAAVPVGVSGTVTCVRCKGSGTTMANISEGLDLVNKGLNTVNHASATFDHGHR